MQDALPTPIGAASPSAASPWHEAMMLFMALVVFGAALLWGGAFTPNAPTSKVLVGITQAINRERALVGHAPLTTAPASDRRAAAAIVAFIRAYGTLPARMPQMAFSVSEIAPQASVSSTVGALLQWMGAAESNMVLTAKACTIAGNGPAAATFVFVCSE